MAFIEGRKIWGMENVKDREKSRFELTDLIWFKGFFYCGFREGVIHHNHPTGRARIIRSSDGNKWESVKLIEWDGADVREPNFSITPEGFLMINAAIAFVSKAPRNDGRFYENSPFDGKSKTGEKHGYHYLLDSPKEPESALEKDVMRQSVTWLSADGLNWSSVYACLSGINTWRWSVSWHNGMGYSVGNLGKDRGGVLYRTRDGKTWNPLLDSFFHYGCGNEAAIAFGNDNTAYCLLRDGMPRSPENLGKSETIDSDGHTVNGFNLNKIHGKNTDIFGFGKPPYYMEWAWKEIRIDWDGDGNAKPSEEVFRTPFGGPKLIRLSDGRFIAAGRVLGPNRDDGHVTLFVVDVENAVFTKFAEMKGSSYGGIVERDGRLWVSYAGEDTPRQLAIFIADIDLPKETGRRS